MNEFILLFEAWELAQKEAIRAEQHVWCELDRYRGGAGAPPSQRKITEAKHLRKVARERLRRLKTFVESERGDSVVI
jgi:hypothetical protein